MLKDYSFHFMTKKPLVTFPEPSLWGTEIKSDCSGLSQGSSQGLVNSDQIWPTVYFYK
jgi:hypothetical protein